MKLGVPAIVLFLSAVSYAQVQISSPANGATVSNPVRFVASAASSSTVTAMAIYVDHSLAFIVDSNKLDTSLTLAVGERLVVVQAWDASGTVQKTPLNLTVSSAGVTVSSPAPGATVPTSVRFVASATSSSPITAMSIYVDSQRVYYLASSSLDAILTLASGTRSISVQAWDSTGKVFLNQFKLNVFSSVPADATTYAKIEEMPGWEHCDKCAGHDGDGPSTTYWMKQGISSPALDGKSAQFFLGGTTPYANALWWKQLGGNSRARNFVYDLFFYITDPTASQALEFDVNQTVGGRKFIFGTECDYKGTKVWRIWDTANVRWVATAIPCAVPKSHTWHRLTFEFQRTSDEKVRFVSLTLNGAKHYLNAYFDPRPVNASEINVAFQMDGNGTQTDYSVWLDQVTLIYW